MSRNLKDFTRRKGFRSMDRLLSEEDGTARLMSDFQIARRAGEVIQPVVKPFRLVLDFSQGHTRYEDHTLVLLAQNAAQLNRLRQLVPRMLAALAVKGLPVTDIDIRIAPPAEPEPEPIPPAPPREHSIAASARLRARLEDFHDPELRATLARLADAIAPRPEERAGQLRSEFDEAGNDARRLLEALARLEDHLPEAPDPRLVPTEEDARLKPELTGVRDRLLSKLTRRVAFEDRLGRLRKRAGDELLAAESARFQLGFDVEGEAGLEPGLGSGTPEPSEEDIARLEHDYLALKARLFDLRSEVKALESALDASAH